METLHTLPSADHKSQLPFRTILIAAGIVTAILCSMVSLKDFRQGLETNVSTSVGMSTLVNAATLVNATSAIWSRSSRLD